MKKWNWALVPSNMEHFLTPTQIPVYHMLISGMTQNEIAKARGVTKVKVNEMGARIKNRLEAAGYDYQNNMTLVSPTPQVLGGRSSLVKVAEDGTETVHMYWNKTLTTREQQAEAIITGIREAAECIKPFEPIKSNKDTESELCTVYTLTDFHLGMYSWADETGASWDMKIAVEVMLNAFHDMMKASPDSEVGIFAQLGDLLHWDGLLALTPTAKNVLDADTRFPLLVQIAIEICVEAVEMLLRKHKRVHVLMAEGNHDMASSVWMRAVMAQAFKHNPRVTVDKSEFPFYSFVWGKTFIGWHHGHLQKMDSLPLLFATDPKFKQDYGSCDHTYIHTGHQHHVKVVEKGGIIVEQHPTLSARDAHGARGFLYSNRATKAITYHITHGEISRITVRPALSTE
ncbi:MAG: winged helix-turn-helix domain-containing protein [bacterium]